MKGESFNMICYIPERVYYYLKKNNKLGDFNKKLDVFRNRIDSCTSLTDFIEIGEADETLHASVISHLDNKKELIEEYRISIGFYSLNALDMLSEYSMDYENRLFALSHLIHSYSIADYAKYKSYVKKYIDLHSSLTDDQRASLGFYFDLKTMSNAIISLGFDKDAGFFSSIPSNMNNMILDAIDDFRTMYEGLDDEHTYIIIVDMIESILAGCDYLLLKDTSPSFILDVHKGIIKACQDGGIFRASFIYLKVLYTHFSLLSSEMAKEENFDIVPVLKDMIECMTFLINKYYETGVPYLINMLKLYDKNDVPMFLCLIRFLLKLKENSRVMNEVIDLHIPDKDREYALSDMDLHKSNHILSPVPNTMKDIDSWFEKATGVLRML